MPTWRDVDTNMGARFVENLGNMFRGREAAAQETDRKARLKRATDGALVTDAAGNRTLDMNRLAAGLAEQGFTEDSIKALTTGLQHDTLRSQAKESKARLDATMMEGFAKDARGILQLDENTPEYQSAAQSFRQKMLEAGLPDPGEQMSKKYFERIATAEFGAPKPTKKKYVNTRTAEGVVAYNEEDPRDRRVVGGLPPDDDSGNAAKERAAAYTKARQLIVNSFPRARKKAEDPETGAEVTTEDFVNPDDSARQEEALNVLKELEDQGFTGSENALVQEAKRILVEREQERAPQEIPKGMSVEDAAMAWGDSGTVSKKAAAKAAAKKTANPGSEKAARVEERFKSDKAMQGYSLGKKLSNGKYQVLDQNGKLVGYYS